jgi:hypothetical protein
MKVIGKWLTETTSDEGLQYFRDLYDQTPSQMIGDYELEQHIVNPEIKAIIFPEYDGEINQMFLIDPEDLVIVWAQGCCDSVFNTDGIAFMELHDRNGNMRFQWAMDNSPYEMNDDDLEECEFDMSKLPEGITREQVIFVAQL